jgi:hypothetical protein
MKYAVLMFTKLTGCANNVTYPQNERSVGLEQHDSIHYETIDNRISWMY